MDEAYCGWHNNCDTCGRKGICPFPEIEQSRRNAPLGAKGDSARAKGEVGGRSGEDIPYHIMECLECGMSINMEKALYQDMEFMANMGKICCEQKTWKWVIYNKSEADGKGINLKPSQNGRFTLGSSGGIQCKE